MLLCCNCLPHDQYWMRLTLACAIVACRGKVEVLQLLLGKGANVKKANDDGWVMSHNAVTLLLCETVVGAYRSPSSQHDGAYSQLAAAGQTREDWCAMHVTCCGRAQGLPKASSWHGMTCGGAPWQATLLVWRCAVLQVDSSAPGIKGGQRREGAAAAGGWL